MSELTLGEKFEILLRQYPASDDDVAAKEEHTATATDDDDMEAFLAVNDAEHMGSPRLN